MANISFGEYNNNNPSSPQLYSEEGERDEERTLVCHPQKMNELFRMQPATIHQPFNRILI